MFPRVPTAILAHPKWGLCGLVPFWYVKATSCEHVNCLTSDAFQKQKQLLSGPQSLPILWRHIPKYGLWYLKKDRNMMLVII